MTDLKKWNRRCGYAIHDKNLALSVATREGISATVTTLAAVSCCTTNETASAPGAAVEMTISPSLLLRADQVID